MNSQKMAIVTGASRRLGRAVALDLARRGYAVGVHFNTSRDQAEETAEEIRKQGGLALLMQADLRDERQVERMFAAVVESGYSLKVLINSAAELTQARFEDASSAAWDAIMDLNLKGAWLCAREAARVMDPSGGVIIQISDAAAGLMWKRYGIYGLSKSALEVLTRSLAQAFAPNIRVLAVAPGLVIPGEDMPDAEWQRLVDRAPLQRQTSIDAVTQAIGFCLDNQALTGQVIAVDGGYHLL